MTELPKFFRDLDAAKNPRPAANGTAAATPLHADAYARKAFNDELNTLAAQQQPGRNHQLNKSAFNLAQLVGANLLDHDHTWTALHTTARRIGLPEGETNATLRSAFDAGTALPRAVTEYGQDDPPPVTVLDPADHPAPGDDEEEEGIGAVIRRRFPALNWATLWEDDTEEEWIVYPLLPARRFVALFSAPKVGKSLLLLELAVGVARGETVIGHRPDRARRVLYIDFENDPRGDVRTRLQAMGRKPEELDDLVYLSYPSLAHLDTYAGAAELLAICAEYGVEVVVIDTISRAVGGDENDNDTWLGLYRHTGLALKQNGIAAIRLDHTGKDASKGMRGGSAKYGDVDAVWSLTHVSDTTFRLECTANRLPIGDKELLLDRATVPYLHHNLNPSDPAAAIAQAREAERFAALDAIYANRPCPGVNDAHRELQARGLGTRKENVRRLLEAWELTYRPTTNDGKEEGQ